jgi:iron complex outermembrane recepter protein
MSIKKKLPLAVAIASLSFQAGIASAETYELEEIIVTAQKRAQSLQDVPLSVNAVSGEMISDMNLTGLDDMASYVPNLTINQGTTSTNIYIRGFGSGANAGFEQSVGMYIDGVYGGRDRQFRSPFMDLERVEVLRGPQGILFGKNTIAGAINISTAKPTQEFEANVKAEFEPRYDQHKVSGVISGGLTESLSGRLAVSQSESGGYFDNTLTGDDGPENKEQVVRGTLVWDLNDDTQVSLKAEVGSFDVDGNQTRITQTQALPEVMVNPTALAALNGPLAGALLFPNNAGLAALRDAATANGGFLAPTATGDYADLMALSDPAYSTDAYKQSADQDRSKTDTENVVLTIEHDWGEYTLTSITGYSAYDASDRQDVDYSPLDYLNRFAEQEFEQFSQEFRITSPIGETFEYIAGVYFQTNELETSDQQDINVASIAGYRQDLDIALSAALANEGLFAGVVNFPPVVPTLHTLATLPEIGTTRSFDQESETYAVFGQLTWHVTDAVDATFGLRYSLEEKESEREVVIRDLDTGGALAVTDPDYILNATMLALSTGADPHTIKDDLREEQWTPSVNVSWNLNEDVMLYTSATIGYKGGGFNESGMDDPNNGGNPYGFDQEKATSYEIGGKTTLLDGAARLNFSYFYTEFEDLQVSTFTQNGFTVGNAGTATSQGLEVDGMWRLSESLTLSGSAAYLDATYDEFEGAPCTVAQNSAVQSCSQDLGGKELIFSPEWSASLALDHVQPLGGELELRSRVDMNFTDNQYLTNDLDPNAEEPANTIYNMRLGLGPATGEWEVALVAKNLTDKEVRNFAADTPGMTGSYIGFFGAPRTISLTGQISF